MTSTKDLCEFYGIKKNQLLEALRNCVSYFLSEEELEPFIERQKYE